MDSHQAKETSSGDTTPGYTPSRFTSGRPRSNSQMTAITSLSAMSTPSISYPGPPINSPTTLSVFGDSDGLDVASLAEKLKRMPSGATAPPSEKGEHASDAEDPSKTTPTAGSEEVSEYSSWANVAEEDVAIGLKRLARLARDDQKQDATGRTAEQHYSERLAALIREAEMEFDCAALH